MHKALWAVAVIAALALGSSVVSAVVYRSTAAKEARQIAVLNHELSVDRNELSVLRREIHAKKKARA